MDPKKRVESFIAAVYMLDDDHHRSLLALLDYKRSFQALESFLGSEDVALLHFLVALRNLNTIKVIVHWEKMAKELYEAYFNEGAYSFHPVLMGKIKISLAAFESISCENIESSRAAAKEAENNVLDTLAQTVRQFVKSRQYFLWRKEERAYAMARFIKDNIELDEAEAVQSIRAAQETEGASSWCCGLVHTIPSMVARLFSAVAIVISPSSSWSCSSEYDDEFLSQEQSKLRNYHLLKGAPWFTLFLEALEHLPIGVAVHKIQRNGTNGIPDRSAGIGLFPYCYVNASYMDNSGGFVAADIYKKPHDALYLKQYDSSNNNTVTLTDNSLASPTRNFSLNFEDEGSSLIAAKPTSLARYGNTLTWRSVHADNCSADSAELTLKKSSEPMPFSYCSSANIGELNKCLADANNQIITSIPMMCKDKAAWEDHYGYVSIMAWKPLVGEDNIPLYYLCLQMSVPVRRIQSGLTEKEVKCAQLSTAQLGDLIDWIPRKLI